MAKVRRRDTAALDPVWRLPAGGASAMAVSAADTDAAVSERRARAIAIPLALLVAWLAVRSAPGAVRLLAMWVHESGHAASAWLCGYMAWPGPWFTPVGSERSLMLTVLMLGGLGYGASVAWRAQRMFWVVVSTTVLALTLVCTFVLGPGRAQQMIVFGGDAGCLVIGTAMMLTVYARDDSPVRRDHLRWALVVLGALAFMDAFHVWSGPIEAIPFGANENGLSDPSVLSEMYGWSVLALQRRYLQVAWSCLAVLGAVYAVALASRERTAP